jgi:hypothetical protein
MRREPGFLGGDDDVHIHNVPTRLSDAAADVAEKFERRGVPVLVVGRGEERAEIG